MICSLQMQKFIIPDYSSRIANFKNPMDLYFKLGKWLSSQNNRFIKKMFEIVKNAFCIIVTKLLY